MEGLAFIQSAVGYEDLGPEPQLRSLEEMGLSIPNSAWVGLATGAVALSVLTAAPDAQAAVRRGDVCPAVSSVQSALVNSGRDPGPVDGAFGGATQFAVIRFQQSRGLAADGVVGSATASALGLSPNISCGTAGGGGGGGGTPTGAIRISTNGGALNVRSGPGSGFGVIGALSNGATAQTTGRTSGGWVELSTGGWVSSSWVTGGAGTGGGGGGGGGGTPVGSVRISTNGSALNVRSGPGAGFGVLGALPNGTTANTTGRTSGGWVELTSGGWVDGSWVR